MNTKKTLLPLICAALTALYFAHPLIQAAGKKNSVPVKSAMINPAEKNNIVQLSLSAADGSTITLEKVENLWTGQVDRLNAVFPCVTAHVTSFIEELTAIKKTYRMLGALEKTVAVESTADFVISWTLASGKTKRISIGGRDFSETMRFIRAENGERSKIESGFDAFLDTTARFWCEPHIIPRLGAGGSAAAENIQRISFIVDGKRTVLTAGTADFLPRLEQLLRLRHGEITDFTLCVSEKPVLRIETEFSNGERIAIPVYRKDEGTYLLAYDLRNGALQYGALISDRTFLRLMNLSPSHK